MILLVDIGNTRLKWSVETNGIMSAMQAMDYQSEQFNSVLHQVWSLLEPPQLLAISSVTADKVTLQIISIAELLWPDIEVYKAQSSVADLGVRSAYQQADQLGVDRWLGMIALQKYYSGNKFIIGCGTAITLDCLDNNGQHLGGVISPGLQLMKRSLSKGTERLSMSSKSHSVGLAGSTDAAIYTGVLYAAIGMIEKVINSFSACNSVILTGGDAQLISEHLMLKSNKIEIEIQPDFVLKGLALLCRDQKN